MTPTLDRDRLLADLRAAEADLDLHMWPRARAPYWRCFGFLQALRVILAAIDDGEYDVDRVKEAAP